MKYPILKERPPAITPADAADDFLYYFDSENIECMILALRSVPRRDIESSKEYRTEFFRLIKEKLKEKIIIS